MPPSVDKIGPHPNPGEAAAPTEHDLRARIFERLHKAVQLTPDNLQVHLDLAEFFLALNRSEEAIEAFKKGLRLHLNDIYIYERIATIYMNQKRHKAAKAFYKKVLESKKTDRDSAETRAAALSNLGEIARVEGRREWAEKYFKMSLSESKDTGTLGCSYHGLGQLYFGLGKFREGGKAAIISAEAEPTAVEAQFQAAAASFLSYDFAAARKYADRALSNLKGKPGNLTRITGDISNINGYLLLLERHYKKAEDVFREVLKQNSNNRGALVGLGHIAIIRKNFTAATKALKPLATKIPNNQGIGSIAYKYLVFNMASLGMAWSSANQNKHREAIKYFDRILKNNANDFFSLLGKGSSLNALGRLDEAEQAFNQVLKLDPDNQYGLAELGLVKLNRGDEKGAEAAFKKAQTSDANKKYTCPYEGLGLVYLRQNKIAQAQKNFERAIAINPDIEYKKFNELAKIYIRQGRTAQAKKLLRKSVKNYPYDPEAKKILDRLLEMNL